MLTTITVLTCDNCKTPYDPNQVFEKGILARRSAHDNGWLNIKGKDWCPACHHVRLENLKLEKQKK